MTMGTNGNSNYDLSVKRVRAMSNPAMDLSRLTWVWFQINPISVTILVCQTFAFQPYPSKQLHSFFCRHEHSLDVGQSYVITFKCGEHMLLHAYQPQNYLPRYHRIVTACGGDILRIWATQSNYFRVNSMSFDNPYALLYALDLALGWIRCRVRQHVQMGHSSPSCSLRSILLDIT